MFDIHAAAPYLSLIVSLATLLIAVGAFRQRADSTRDDVRDLKKRMANAEENIQKCREHNLQLVQNYVTAEQFNKAMDRIEESIRQLLDKLIGTGR